MADDGWDEEDVGWSDDDDFEAELAAEVAPAPIPASAPVPAAVEKKPEKKISDKAKGVKAGKKVGKASTKSSTWSDDDDWGNDGGDWLAPISATIDKQPTAKKVVRANKAKRSVLKLGGRARNRAGSTGKQLSNNRSNVKPMSVETAPAPATAGRASTTR